MDLFGKVIRGGNKEDRRETPPVIRGNEQGAFLRIREKPAFRENGGNADVL
jgi:hypothetical protein